MENIDTTENKQQSKRRHGFQKGLSGNPNGRPVGRRNNATLAAQALLNGESEKLTRKAIELALMGDTVALKLCLERIMPAIKEMPVLFNMPAANKISDLPMITASILESVSNGDLLPGEAEKITRIVDAHRTAIEVSDLEARIKALELSQEKH